MSNSFDSFLAKDMLNENSRIGYIRSAGRVLFNKNKVTPDHAASKEAGVWGDGPQSIRTYKSNDGKVFHVSSFGLYKPGSKYDVEVGAMEKFKHAGSHKDLPAGKLLGVVNYKDGKKVDHYGEDHSKTAAAFYVYK